MRYDGLGCSNYTPVKQANFEKILRMHISITENVMPKWGQHRYYFWDLNPGPGCYETPGGVSIIGSPIVFLNVANEKRVLYDAVFIEKCEESYNALVSNTAQLKRIGCNIQIRHGDHSEILDQYYGGYKSFGLIYSDPSDTGIPFDALKRFSERYPKVEILIHVAATAIKRARAIDTTSDLLSRISKLKPYWMAKEPTGRWQWTFLLGSNYDGFKNYKSIGFYRIDTKAGNEIIERINYTKAERNALYQSALPELCGISEASDISRH